VGRRDSSPFQVRDLAFRARALSQQSYWTNAVRPVVFPAAILDVVTILDSDQGTPGLGGVWVLGVIDRSNVSGTMTKARGSQDEGHAMMTI
jgi:hypothetical protein